MVWVYRKFLQEYKKKRGRVGPELFCFNAAGSVFYVEGAIGTSTLELVEDQLIGLFEVLEDCHGTSWDWISLAVDTATRHHKALTKSYKSSAYNQPSSELDAALRGGEVDIESPSANAYNSVSSTSLGKFPYRVPTINDSFHAKPWHCCVSTSQNFFSLS